MIRANTGRVITRRRGATRIGDSAGLGHSATRLGMWLVESRVAVARLVSALVTRLAVALYVLSGLNSVVSWPADRVLVEPASPQRFTAWVILPGWAWLAAVLLLIVGWHRLRTREGSKFWRPSAGR